MEVPIPGYSSSSGIDTQKIIQDLLEVKRKPIYTLEKRIQDSQNQTRLWNNLDKDMRQFQSYAKKLYGFENPFDERSVTSSDETVLTAEASRGAQVGEYELLVKQTADADVWASDSVRKDIHIPKGLYTFSVGEKRATVNFIGGDIQKFINAFTDEIDEKLISIKSIQSGTDKNYTTLILESKKRGKKFALTLSDSAEKFSHDLGFQSYNTKSARSPLAFTDDTITRVISDESFIEKKSNKFSALNPGGIAHFTLPSVHSTQQSASQESMLGLQFTLEPFQQQEITSHAIIRDNIEATLEDVTVSGVIEMQNNEDTEEALTEKLSLVFSADGMQTLYALPSQERQNTVSINLPLREMRDAQGNVSFIIANPFPRYKLVLQNAEINTDGKESALVVKNPISRARNAIIQLNGVNLERETNVLNDMLPGLTLTAKRASDDVVFLSVKNNEKMIKDSIINFVGSYNQMMKKITLYTSSKIVDREFAVLDSLQIENGQEREQAKKDLGQLSGNFSLIRLTNSLITAVSRQYPTETNSQITMLRNIGIASNISDSGASRTRLGSRFLDIDEPVLDEALSKNIDEVAEIFGSDQNNDLAIEEGVAFATAELIRPFTITGGIVSQKRKTLQRGVDDNYKQISRYEKRVKDYHQKIKKDFATMERSLSKLEDATNSLKGLSGSGSQ